MSARYQQGKSTEILYAAKNFTTGLTDVKINMHKMDGTLVFQDVIMIEVSTTGVYKHKFNMPTAIGTFLITANSDTQDKKDSAVIYTGGFPGNPRLVSRGGGLTQRHLKTTWTEKEKLDLIIMVNEVTKKLNALIREKERLKDMVAIQGKLLNVYSGSISKLESLESTSKEALKVIKEKMASGATTENISEVIANIKQLGIEIEKMKERESTSPKQNEEELESLEAMKKQLEALQEQSMILIKSLPDEAIDRALEDNENE